MLNHIYKTDEFYFAQYQLQTPVFYRYLEGITTSLGWLAFAIQCKDTFYVLRCGYFFNAFFSFLFHLFPSPKTYDLDRIAIDLIVSLELSYIFSSFWVLPFLWVYSSRKMIFNHNWLVSKIAVGSFLSAVYCNDLNIGIGFLIMVLFYYIGTNLRFSKPKLAALSHCLFHVGYGYQTFFLSVHFKFLEFSHQFFLIGYLFYQILILIRHTFYKKEVHNYYRWPPLHY